MRRLILAVACLLSLVAVSCGSEAAFPTATPTKVPSQAAIGTQRGQQSTQARIGGPEILATPGITIDKNKQYSAVFKTEIGDFKVQLFASKAPVTVNNFVHLARTGYYDGSTFHRVLEGFMAQGGDPTGTGSGGPGWVIPDEFDPSLRHDRPGIISMANRGPNTGGSQFFITFEATPWLDDKHAVFGRVVEGIEIVKKIQLRDPAQKPSAPPGTKISKIEISES